MKTIFFVTICIFMSSVLASAGLLKSDVVVVDQKGAPIKDATVQPISLSINYPKVKTNKNGKANLGWKLQKVEWVTVSKEGYQTVMQAKYKGPPKPVKITLKKLKP